MNNSKGMRPQDVVVLLKIIATGKEDWYAKDLAAQLFLSPAEVSYSLSRSAQARLLDGAKRVVAKGAFLEFLRFGLPYVFPVQPGGVVRGYATAHSAAPLNKKIKGNEQYVWPHAKGAERGQAIEPLYKGAVDAALEDTGLYELLALVDALRVGRVRERDLAYKLLAKRFK